MLDIIIKEATSIYLYDYHRTSLFFTGINNKRYLRFDIKIEET